MENEDNKIQMLVDKEVTSNASSLMAELMTQEKYFDDLAGLMGEEDAEGNIPEALEYWIVTPWLAQKLKAHSELVAEFFDLTIWGRQTSGQPISADTVIEDITRECYKPKDS